MTIENKRSESLKIYVDGELKQPEIKGNTTTRLSDKVFAGGSIRVVAKAAKGGTELWKKEYRGEEMDEIRKDDELYVVVPDLK